MTFQEFTNNVKNSSIALRENYQALEFLAENTDLASEAMNTIQNQQKTYWWQSIIYRKTSYIQPR